jgi:hypothetical protein
LLRHLRMPRHLFQREVPRDQSNLVRRTTIWAEMFLNVTSGTAVIWNSWWLLDRPLPSIRRCTRSSPWRRAVLSFPILARYFFSSAPRPHRGASDRHGHRVSPWSSPVPLGFSDPSAAILKCRHTPRRATFRLRVTAGHSADIARHEPGAGQVCDSSPYEH